jgi:hypothetical protein
MKSLLAVITFALGLFLINVQSTAFAAEPTASASATAASAAASTPAAADTTAKAKTNKKIQHHTRFSCTTEECTCRGGADCNDLGSTHLCKINMTCEESTCRCSRR